MRRRPVRSGRGVRRVAEAWARHGPAAVRVAYSLTGDRERAVRLATVCVRHALGTWHDLRGPDEMQIYVLRHVIRRARPRWWRNKPGDFAAWTRLSHRRRAAASLVLGEGLDAAEAARILECSRTTVEALVRKGIAGWASAAGSREGEPRARLEAWLRDRSRDVRDDAAGPALRPAGLLRACSALGLLLAVVGMAVGTVAAGRRLTVAAPVTGTSAPVAERLAGDDGSVPPPRVGLMDSRRDWCPDPDYTLPFGRRPRAKAARVAVAFDAAVVENDWRTIAELIDPSPLALGVRQRKWDSTESARGLTVTYSSSAALDEPVRSFCGPRVAARSWKVVMHDSNGLTSEGLAAFYLVRRATGWKVWGSY
jgi:hypothetical protein